MPVHERGAAATAPNNLDTESIQPGPTSGQTDNRPSPRIGNVVHVGDVAAMVLASRGIETSVDDDDCEVRHGG